MKVIAGSAVALSALFLASVVFPVDSAAVPWPWGKLKELREIKFFGTYYAGDPFEIRETEEYYREEGVLKQGETLADSPQTKHKLEYLGKERFRISPKPLVYCYGEILDKDRRSAIVFDPDLRARMYDRAGNLLAEDTLRDSDSPRWRQALVERRIFSRGTVAYLPYRENGDVTVRIVRLEGEKEIVLEEFRGLNSLEDLQDQERRRNPYGFRLYRVNDEIPYEYALNDLGPGDLFCHM